MRWVSLVALTLRRANTTSYLLYLSYLSHLFVVWLSLLQVGPLTLSQMEFCFSKRHKTPEICTDYATVQIAS